MQLQQPDRYKHPPTEKQLTKKYPVIVIGNFVGLLGFQVHSSFFHQSSAAKKQFSAGDEYDWCRETCG